jgi:serine/threonine protein kinase
LGLARGIDPFNAVTRNLSPEHESYPSPQELNRLLPSYRIEKLIGQGGMGAVYQAHQPSLDRAVAIKVMSHRFANDPSFAERFSREAKTMARLNHQNIVNVYDYGQIGNACYLVMEYVDGLNLRQAMVEGNLSAEQGLAIVPQVCEALQFAHDEGIVHRDIKPENILVDKKGRVKIADFGLAKLIDEDQPSFTLTGSRQVLGTLNYMAPEQIEKPTTVDHRADIYSLGVVLYELLTGELPLGRFQLPGEKFAGHASLDDVVVRTLEKQPDRRFQQASEVRSAVEVARASASFHNVAPASANHAGNRLEKRPAPPIKSPEKISTEVPRVKFEIENPWHGMTVTRGILAVQPDGVAINYSKRDTVFNSTMFGESGKHLIPYSEILKAELKEGWFSNSLILRLDTIDDYAALFAEEPGTLIFSIKSSEEEEVRSVINSIRAKKGHQPLPYVSLKPEEQRSRAQKRMMWPAIGLLIAGLINSVFLPVAVGWVFLFKPHYQSSVEAIATQLPGSTPLPVSVIPLNGNPKISQAELPASTAPATEQADGEILKIPEKIKAAIPNTKTTLSTWQWITTAGFFLIGLVLCSGGLAMLMLKNWAWCMATSIFALVPIHPGAVVGIPAGIIALIQLNRQSNRSHFE